MKTTVHNSGLKCVCLCALTALLSVAASAVPTNVSTVAELVGALTTLNNDQNPDHTVVLAAGNYYVGDTAVCAMNSESHLLIKSLKIRGATDNPRDTVIYGAGESDTLRILYAVAGAVENLTVSNGCFRDCGGIKCERNTTQCSNVVVTCCLSASGTAGTAGVGNGTWSHCEFSDNYAPKAMGGACSGGYYSNCRFTGNTGYYGGAVGGSAGVVDSVLTGNRAIVTGGASHEAYLTNCVILCNTASSDYGGGVSGGVVAGNSVISNNTAVKRGGGAYGAKLFDTTVIHNIVRNDVGGTEAHGGGIHTCVASNCWIVGNASVPSVATGRSGGAYDSTMTNCVVANNYANEDGGGMWGGSAFRCVISNNVSRNSSPSIRGVSALVNCRLWNSTVHSVRMMVNCRVEGCTPKVTLEPGANIHTNGTFDGATLMVQGDTLAVTNCLFVNNEVTDTLFNAPTANCAEFVNCTVASNRIGSTHKDYRAETRAGSFINCIFGPNVDRTNPSIRHDLWLNTCPNASFRNCLIGSGRQSSWTGVEINTVTNNNPSFDFKNAEDRYSLSRTSPARGKGLVMDWMNGATDIRADGAFPRLDGGKVDIGCYQYWPVRFGTLLLFR